MANTTDLILHRSRFYVAELCSINCIAYDAARSRVALLRRRIRKYQPQQGEMRSEIEIWNMQNKASFIEQVITEDDHDAAGGLALLEDLVWSQRSGRLFSCGLNTYVNEYDLERGRIRRSHCTNSSPAWCLAIDDADTAMAVGTEDGYVCVYNIETEQCFEYEKILDRNDNRILCLAWYTPNNFPPPPPPPPSSSSSSSITLTSPLPPPSSRSRLLIGGSIDYIKIWQFDNGRCADFIKVGNTGLVIWCVAVLPDFTIVSGDSNGTTSFWNGATGTLNGSFNAHKGDVLAICAAPSGHSVFASGVDPAIYQFSRNSHHSSRHNQSNEKKNINASASPLLWHIAGIRRPHSHDVRALRCASHDWLLSGGVDGFFVQSSTRRNKSNIASSLQVNHLSNYAHKFAIASIRDDEDDDEMDDTPQPKQQQPQKQHHRNYICMQYEKFIQIWKLGNTEHDLPHTRAPINSVQVTALGIADNAIKLLEISSRKAITAFAFNSEWLIYANHSAIKAYTWTEDKIERVKVLSPAITTDDTITHIGILGSVARFAIAHGRTIELFALDRDGIFAECAREMTDRVHRILPTADGRLVVSIGDQRHTITICDGRTTLHTIASFRCPLLPTAMAIRARSASLWIACANSILLQYDLRQMRIARTITIGKCRSNENRESQCFNEHWPIKQIAFGGTGNGGGDDTDKLVLFSNDHNLYCLHVPTNQITKCDQYRHVLFVGNLADNELAMLEVTPEARLQKLPAALRAAKSSFGT